MLAAIRQWVIKTMMKGQTGVVRTLPKQEIIEMNVQITAERMMRNGINPEDLKTVGQVENVVKQIDTPKVNVNAGVTSVKKADVLDMEGNKIDTSKGIMGGEEIKPIDELQNYTKSKEDIVQDLVDRKFGKGYFDTVDESEAAIKARIEADNEKGIASMKKKLDDPEEKADGGRIGLKGGSGFLKFLKKFKIKQSGDDVKDFLSKRQFMKDIVGNTEKSRKARQLREIKKNVDNYMKQYKGYQFPSDEQIKIDLEKKIQPILNKGRKLNADGGRIGYAGGSDMGTVSGTTRSANTGLKGGYQNTGTSPVERPGGGGGGSKPPPVVTRTVTKPNVKDTIRRVGNTFGDISYFKNLIKFNPTGIIKNVGGKILMDKILGDESSLDTEDEYSGIKGQLAEAINFGLLPGAKDKFTPNFNFIEKAAQGVKDYKGTTKQDYVDAVTSGAFGNTAGSTSFDRNVGDLFKGVDLGKKSYTNPFATVTPTFKSLEDGTGRGIIDIDKGALEQDALEALPKEFFVGAEGGLAKFADGGRIGYKAGSVDKMRRLFLKAIGAGTAGIGAAKSGIFSFGKGAGKEVAKEVAQQTTTSTPPPYFFKLAEKIKMMGDDVTATTDRTIAKTLKSKDGKSEYLLEEDLATGDTSIKKIYKEDDNMITDVEIMELRKGEVVMGKNGKPVKTPDEYEEVTEVNKRIYKDDYNASDYTDGINVDEIIKEVDDKVPSIKYASGGLAYMLGE